MTPSSRSSLMKHLAVAALLVAASTLSQAAQSAHAATVRHHAGHAIAKPSGTGTKAAHNKKAVKAVASRPAKAHAPHAKQATAMHAAGAGHRAAALHHRTAVAKTQAGSRHATAKAKASGQRHAVSHARHPAAHKATSHRAH